MSLLTDDLLAEILSRLPLKSFCRFKCVCKHWRALSSDPHYRKRFPRTPVGILYREDGTGIHLARLPSSNKEIETTLSFVPCYESLTLMDCSDGLLLCYHGGITTYLADISHVIVCNPATQEWMSLPNTEPGPRPPGSFYNLVLCFDPSWSQHFYVFNFQSGPSMDGEVCTEVKIFSSEDFAWSSCRWKRETKYCRLSRFMNGVLYVRNLLEHVLLANDAPDPCSQWLSQRIIKLPGLPNDPGMFSLCAGSLCQSSGVLCYVQQEFDGCMMRIWSLEGTDSWVVRHRLSLNNVFGRDWLLHFGLEGFWCFDYDIDDFDLERELVILVDRMAHKIVSYSITTGKCSEILKFSGSQHIYQTELYVPYYASFQLQCFKSSRWMLAYLPYECCNL